MKTSNRLLTAFLIVILVSITIFLAIAKYQVNSEVVTSQGPAVSENRNVENFDKIKAEGRIKVYLTQGSQQKLELKGARNLLGEVESKIQNGELTLSLKNRISKNDKVEAYITAPTVTGLDFSAGASVETAQALKGENMDIEAASGSHVNLILQYKNINCQSSSGSLMELQGNAETARFDLSSGSEVKAGELATNSCRVEASSGAHADIKVLQELTADINSGGNLKYSGEPIKKDLNTSAGGTIEKK